MANERPQGDDDLPQIGGKVNEMFVERVAGVKLREAEHKNKTKNHALSHASTGEHSLGSRSRSSRLCLGRETWQTSPRRTSSRSSDTGWETLLKRRVRSAGQLLRYETR